MPPLPDGARRLPAGDDLALELPSGFDVDAYLRDALSRGARVVSVTPRRESLEDLFVREAKAEDVDNKEALSS